VERARSVAKERGKKVFAGRLVFPSFSTKRFPLFLALSLSSSLVFLFFFFLFGPWSLPWPSTRRACLQGKREKRERERQTLLSEREQTRKKETLFRDVQSIADAPNFAHLFPLPPPPFSSSSACTSVPAWPERPLQFPRPARRGNSQRPQRPCGRR